MPRAKRKKKPIELQPWCYYCDKVCADVVALEAHIRMRHSSCTECTRRPGSMSGLVKHMASVHKMELSKVPNAIGKRSDPSVDVYGMMGNPLARTYHPSHPDGLPVGAVFMWQDEGPAGGEGVKRARTGEAPPGWGGGMGGQAPPGVMPLHPGPGGMVGPGGMMGPNGGVPPMGYNNQPPMMMGPGGAPMPIMVYPNGTMMPAPMMNGPPNPQGPPPPHHNSHHHHHHHGPPMGYVHPQQRGPPPGPFYQGYPPQHHGPPNPNHQALPHRGPGGRPMHGHPSMPYGQRGPPGPPASANNHSRHQQQPAQTQQQQQQSRTGASSSSGATMTANQLSASSSTTTTAPSVPSAGDAPTSSSTTNGESQIGPGSSSKASSAAVTTVDNINDKSAEGNSALGDQPSATDSGSAPVTPAKPTFETVVLGDPTPSKERPAVPANTVIVWNRDDMSMEELRAASIAQASN